MFCSKCGSENKNEARFCNSCGDSLAGEGPVFIGRDAQRPAPKKKRGLIKSMVYGVLGLAGILFVLAIIMTMSDSSPIACDDNDVKELLRDTVDQSQFARLGGLSAVDIKNMQDTGSVEDNLSCTADVTFNNLNQVRVSYTVTPRGDSGQYWLEFKVLGGV